jgi:hypothetical protein
MHDIDILFKNITLSKDDIQKRRELLHTLIEDYKEPLRPIPKGCNSTFAPFKGAPKEVTLRLSPILSK